MKYNSIFIDVDGTLITDDHHVTHENINAVQRALDSNIDIILCSGRTPVSLFSMAEQLNYTPKYLIGFNGGSILTANGEALYKNTLEQEYAQEIVSYIEQHPICVGVYIESDIIIVKNPPKELRSIMDKRITRISVQKNEKITVDNPVMKIMAVGNHEDLKVIYDYYRDKVNDRFVMAFTHGHILEFIPIGVNKGAAIQWLCNHTGADIKNTVAIGDNYNDIEMIKKCGFGATPQNGVDAAKEVADLVTANTNNNSAVAELIKHVIYLNETTDL